MSRFWLRSLYGLLNPPHHALGSVAIVDRSRVPEYDRAISIINYWVEERLFSLNPKTHNPTSRLRFLSSTVQMASLGFLLNHEQTQRYLNRVPFVIKRPPPVFFRGHDSILHCVLRALDGSGENSFVDGIIFLQCVLSLVFGCTTSLTLCCGYQACQRPQAKS